MHHPPATRRSADAGAQTLDVVEREHRRLDPSPRRGVLAPQLAVAEVPAALPVRFAQRLDAQGDVDGLLRELRVR